MKWIRVLGLLAIILPLATMPVLATVLPSSLLPARNPMALSADILIKATPNGPVALTAPLSFTVTKITDQDVSLRWTPAVSGTQTLIMAKFGSYPANRTDGYQAYYGNGSATNDTALDLDQTALNIYYRAWSYNATSNEWVGYAQGNVGGAWLTLIAEILIVGMILGLTFWKRTAILYLLSVPVTVTFGLGLRSTFTDNTGIVISITFAALGIYCLLKAGETVFKR